MTDTPAPTRLEDLPDWQYLLQEFYYAYRYGSAGGSASIRSHQRQVRERLSRAVAANPRVDPGTPAAKPVTAHLGRALDNGLRDRSVSIVTAVTKVKDILHWQYGYDRMPRQLARKYAFAELLGPTGPVLCNDLILGLVLFAPRCTYPAHSHDGITESYLCLSGAISENDAGVYVPGSLILNQPGHEHQITTQDREPALLAYAWIGDPQRLASPGMELSSSPRRGKRD